MKGIFGGDKVKKMLQGIKKGESYQDSDIELEKGDLPALIISGLLVFGPVFLGLFLFIYWLF